jgi:hypothetical protein
LEKRRGEGKEEGSREKESEEEGEEEGRREGKVIFEKRVRVRRRRGF